MKIKKVEIRNFRSIKNISFEPSNCINNIIGANNTGKSNILDAFQKILGVSYPVYNSFERDDHYECNYRNEIKIRIEFDDNTILEYKESNDDKKGKLTKNNNSVSSEDRENYCVSYLGIKREIGEFCASNKWTLIGRIMNQINQKFITQKDDKGNFIRIEFENKISDLTKEYLFNVRDDSDNKIFDYFLRILNQETSNYLNVDSKNISLDLKLYDPWHYYKTLQMTYKDEESANQFIATEMGMGIQALIMMAALKAYSLINIKEKNPIFIDEPELYLHPQAQRVFYKQLREMSYNGLQIFYATHSSNFLSTEYFDEVCLVRKTKENGTTINKCKIDDFIEDFKIRYPDLDINDISFRMYIKKAFECTGNSQRSHEAFFAKKIILVEGESEQIILPLLFDKVGFDLDKEGVTIVNCGGKSELDRFYRIYNEFKIPCYIVFDGDLNNADQHEAVKSNKIIFMLFKDEFTDKIPEFPDGKPHQKFLGFEKNIEEALNTKKYDRDNIMKLVQHTRKEFIDKDEVPDWFTELVEKIKTLGSLKYRSCLMRKDGAKGEISKKQPFT